MLENIMRLTSMILNFVCVYFFLYLPKKEDPRLKIPAHLRGKTSLDSSNDLGPLPVSL